LADRWKIADGKNVKPTGLTKDELINDLLKPLGNATRTPAGGGGKKKKQKEELEGELLPSFTLFKQS
jgi:hypothetical protein